MARKTKQPAPVARNRPVPDQSPQNGPQDDVRRRSVSEAACYRADAREFAPGRERDYRLAAERELDAARSRPV